MRFLRYLWASPWTFFGLAIGLLFGGRICRREGVWEVHGPVVRWVLLHLWIPAKAITIGHVVLGQDTEALEVTRAHERVHVRQYERWGVFFVPVYLFCSLWLYIRGRDGYRENPFEVEAYAVDDCRG
ncbi:MAG: hypothetical protein AAF664_05870 [Planctomycetota bacterium]